MQSSVHLTLYLIPPDKPDEHEDAIKIQLEDPVGDTFPKKVKHVGDYTIKLKNEKNVLFNQSDIELKVGANYQFLMQYDEDVDSVSSKLIMVSISLKS